MFDMNKVKIEVASEDDGTVKDFVSKPLLVVSRTVTCENGVDVYLVQGNVRYQLFSQQSKVYSGIEYVFKGRLEKGQQISFVHFDGRRIPVRSGNNCGYTLVGKAKDVLQVKSALVCYDSQEDQEYVYVNQSSSLFYIGETSDRTIYVRVFDNFTGNNNDRWLVISVD